MARMTRVGVGYNVQIATGAKHKLIAGQAVPNPVLDLGLLAACRGGGNGDARGGPDRGGGQPGTFEIEDLEACEKVGVTAYVPKPMRGPAAREGFFSKEDFRYDPERDAFSCPGGQTLASRHESRSRGIVKIDHSNRNACKACALRPRCTRTFRRVSRLGNEAVLDRVAARLAARPDILDQRRQRARHPFGTIKQWMNQGAFLMGRLEDVRGAFSPTALAYNVRRAITLVGVPSLVAAARR